MKKFYLFLLIAYSSVKVNAQSCQAAFYFGADTIPNGINFFDASNDSIATWHWDFGDGDTSNLQQPNHTYSSNGIYYVCLTITDSSMTCTDTYCDSILVGNCFANFIHLPDSVSNSSTIQFYNFSAGTITNFSWDFGDSYSSSEFNPFHTYTTTGTYNVCLTVMDTVQLCTITFCDSVTVGNHPNIIYSLCNGNWSDPSTWSTSSVPLSTDTIIIKNYISLDQNLIMSAPSLIFIDSSATLCGNYELTVTKLIAFDSLQVGKLDIIGSAITTAYVGSATSISVTGSWTHSSSCTGCPFTCTSYSCLTGINKETIHPNSININPNPFNSSTTIQIQTEIKNSSLTICNVFGQTVQRINVNSDKIILDRDNLPSGIYFVSLTQDNKRIATDKLIIAD